ncbi:hypothetical protein EV1_028141 [Malus domestica]
MVSWMNFSNTFTKALNNPSSLVTKNTREETFRIIAAPGISVGVAERGVQNLDPDLFSLRRSHLHVFDHQRLIGFPGHRRFAGDDLTLGSHGFD